MSKDLFPARSKSNPTIYAYKLLGVEDKKGFLKVGFTNRGAKTRVHEQLRTSALKYEIVLESSAMRSDGTSFSDHDVHNQLIKDGIRHIELEWFKCELEDVESAIIAIKEGISTNRNRNLTFKMRPEQLQAVEKAAIHFRSFKKTDPTKIPHFLWNAKMRFGKTFAAYQLALEMKWRKVLILTFKPAVQSAWEEDLETHKDFEGWQFISKNGLSYSQIDKSRPFVCFGSFQDFLGKNKSTGGIKVKNEWVHLTNWDCVIFDEYHYGAWREKSKDLFEGDESEEALELGEVKEFDEAILPITTDHYLYLSGTPFRALESGEFIEEQIFNWTYADEQKAKETWLESNNPYSSLPRMVMLTYKMPDDIREIALSTEFNEFDLNVFFHAKGKGKDAVFTYESEVQKWLDLIRGSHKSTSLDNLKLGTKRPPMPFSDIRLLNLLSHTFWFLPTVAACHAMKNLLLQRQNNFYHSYEIVVAAGNDAGLGVEALGPVYKAMGDPLNSKTITLSCGKLTTGVSVRPWTAILMLRNCSSPETYFQAAFRVQTPWTVKNPDGKSPNEVEILKNECYIFDFAPNRALSQVADYSLRLNINEKNPEKKVEEFIRFLPILAYDGSSMKEIDAKGVLDISMSGTTATLLARRWESALLVNVDNETLSRLLSNKKAMDALMNIEGFRALNQEIETIINKSEAVKKAKKEKEEFTPKEKKQLTEEEKEYKSKRKMIQEKLIKFATRIPIFMYLTDFRERSLIDVITQLEPGLFKKVTGLEQKDFELLLSLNVFNYSLMNDAVYKFKRYEDASLEYVGINKHLDEDVGLFSTSISRQEYQEMPG
jgi:hypothetical protein